MILLSGNSNKALSNSVAKVLGTEVVHEEIKYFPNGEIMIKIQDSLQGEYVAALQTTSISAHQSLMELFLILDHARQKGAQHIVAVLPYFYYARQNSLAQTISKLFQESGATEIITLDLHSKDIEPFFDIPVQNLQPTSLIEEDIRQHFDLSNSVLVAPDQGALPRTKEMARRLNLSLAHFQKRRDHKGEPHVIGFIGDVAGKDCLILDDIVDTAKTLCNAAQTLKEHGAKGISAYATHGVLSKDSHQRLKESSLQHLIITDSLLRSEETQDHPKIRQISIAPLLANALLNSIVFPKRSQSRKE